MSTADNATGDMTGTPGGLAGEEELRSGRAAMIESPLFTHDPDHAEFKIELQKIRERLDHLSDNLATLRAEVHDLAAGIHRSTSS